MNGFFAQADSVLLPLAADSVDLVIGSPPYMKARLYLEGRKKRNLGIARKCEDWVSWMLQVVAECCRVSRGLVIVNCAGQTEDWLYNPGPELLLGEWWRRCVDRASPTYGWRCWRPCYFHRVGIPGSGGRQWYRADTEYLLAFTKYRGALPYGEPTANGHIPKFTAGGEFSHRLSSGERVNQWGRPASAHGAGRRRRAGHFDTSERPSHEVMTKTMWNQSGPNRRENGDYKRVAREGTIFRHAADGSVKGGHVRDVCKIANPGNVLKAKVGGGHMGHKLAHRNEAPYPERLPEFFINSHCPVGGIVLDPFSGSGSTVAAAEKLGRIGLGFDLRMSQCLLGRERLLDITREPIAPQPVRIPSTGVPSMGMDDGLEHDFENRPLFAVA